MEYGYGPDAHMYRREDTGETVDARKHGSYTTQHSFVTRDDILMLGHDEQAVEPWVVTGYRYANGAYFGDLDAARQEYVRRIAASFDMVAGHKDGLFIRPGDLKILQERVKGYADAALEFEASEDGPDGDETEKAVAMRDAADEVTDQLRQVGAFQAE